MDTNLNDEKQLDQAVPRIWNELHELEESDHLRGEELVEYVDGSLPRARMEAARVHVAECDICSGDVADLQQLRFTMHRRRPRMWLPYSIAAAVAAIAFSIVLFNRPQPAPKLVQQRKPAPPVHAVEDPVLAKWRSLAESAIQTGSVEKPQIIASLNPGREVLRGVESDAHANVITPAGVVVDQTRPEFRWSSAGKATAVVSVFVNSDLVIRSGELRDRMWRPPDDLARGMTYTWQVALTDAKERTIVPAPTEPPARFVVMSEADHDELQATLQHVQDPLIRGVVYAHFGLQQDAIEELEKSGRAATLLESVRLWNARGTRVPS
jgi:hypothetical protein